MRTHYDSAYCSLNHVFVLLLLTSLTTNLLLFTNASTLVYEGHSLAKANEDKSDATFNLQSPINSAGSGCSWNTYYEKCTVSGGTGSIFYNSGSKGPSYNISSDGKTVTYCSRYRRDSVCVSSFTGTTTTSTIYSGVRITYNVVYNPSKVAAIYLSEDQSDECSGVCTLASSPGQLVYPTDPKSKCDNYPGDWTAVHDSYYDTCAPPKETCEELVVSQGCEDSETSIVGTYRPTDECNSFDNVDTTRSVYYSSSPDKYLFYRTGQNEWVFSSGCSSLFYKAFLDAGNEPYLDTDEDVQCYDGGFGSDKRYTYTDIAMKCKKKSTNSGDGGFLGSGGQDYYSDDFVGGGSNPGAIVGGVISIVALMVIASFVGIHIQKKKRRSRNGNILVSEEGQVPSAVPVPAVPVSTAPQQEESVSAVPAVFPIGVMQNEETFAIPIPAPFTTTATQEVEVAAKPPPPPTVPSTTHDNGANGTTPARNDIFGRLQELEKIKSLITTDEYTKKKADILNDL